MRKYPIDVVIDTDIGDDIDDAAALCLAMQSPELNILGVTTVFKNTRKRAQIATRLLRLGGYGNVPVYAGASMPMENCTVYGKTIDYTENPYTYQKEYEEELIDTQINASQFIIQTLEAAPTPVCLITLGPLTNVADVLCKRKDLKSRIDTIYIMGGAYFSIHAGEYNFSCDPEAADIVLRSGIKMVCAGLDVTFQCSLSDTDMSRLYEAKHPCLKMLMNLQKAWGHNIILHDPLAVLLSITPSLAKIEKMMCRMELEGEYARGMVVNLSNWTWNVQTDETAVDVAVSVDRERVVRMFMERVLRFEDRESGGNK